MFCGKCGNKNEDGVRFCGVCGSPAEASMTGEQTNPPRPTVLDVGGFAQFDATDENKATITIAGILLNATLVFKSLAVMLFVALILPFYSIVVTIGIRVSTSINGFRMAFGRGDASFSGVLLFLIPIIIFALFQFRKEIQGAVAAVKGKLFMITAGLSIIGFILIFSARVSLNAPFISIRPSAGFIISLLLYMVSAAISICLVLAEKRR